MQLHSLLINAYYNELNTDELEKQSKSLFASSKRYIKQTKLDKTVWQNADSGSRINYNCKYRQSLFVVNH